jgi:hypothetical protein
VSIPLYLPVMEVVLTKGLLSVNFPGLHKTYFEFPWTFEAVGDLQWIHHKCECSSFAYRHALT